jgi:hypothetical protein
MNNIQEDDWAEDSWSRHSGMFCKDNSKSSEEATNKSDPSEDIKKGEQSCSPHNQ